MYVCWSVADSPKSVLAQAQILYFSPEGVMYEMACYAATHNSVFKLQQHIIARLSKFILRSQIRGSKNSETIEDE